MPTDYQSTNPIVMQFPRFAGGKFIMNCLALSRHCVPQDREIAEHLIDNPGDYIYRLSSVMKTLPPASDMINWINCYELGDRQLFGPSVARKWTQGISDDNDTNDITKRLSISNMKFFITCHSGPDQASNVLKVWPRASIVMLVNHRKFSLISARLKSENDNVDAHAGNYCQSKYQQLAGTDWPTWTEFKNIGFNINRLTGYPEHTLAEMGQFYRWNLISTDPIMIDIDSNIFDQHKFLHMIQQLYSDLGLDDFNANLVGTFWKSYINLHVDIADIL